ncbi:MAG: hypothetical protein J0L75_10885 [Spirochaetes bacterium]|nr:hypothetical protein [Spirochaetota bacterium]
MSSKNTSALAGAALLGLVALAALVTGCRSGADGAKQCPAGSAKLAFPAPESHRGDWVRMHGKTMNGMADAESCLVCHAANDCQSCHASKMPGDHRGGLWRAKTHGLSAASDRDRCASCHREDYCASCHRETAPRSHGANWAKKHCVSCHLDNGAPTDESCTVCHKRRPHTTAPHPINHSLDCKSCHVK